MRTATLLGALAVALALSIAPFGEANERMGPHPVRGWKGNEFLFQVQPQGDIIHLVGYRAIGHKWQLVGSTQIRKGQRSPDGGWLQEVWFKGRHLKPVAADLSNPWWRHYPADDAVGPLIE